MQAAERADGLMAEIAGQLRPAPVATPDEVAHLDELAMQARQIEYARQSFMSFLGRKYGIKGSFSMDRISGVLMTEPGD